MRLDVARDLRDSTRDFIEKVWPAIRDWCGGGELIPVEAVTETVFAGYLDTHSGIDHWQIKTDEGLIRGIASRVQWGTDWRTFTIRESRPSGVPTELQKRRIALRQIEEGYLFPGLTCQAYLSGRGGELLSVAVVSTKELFDYIDNNEMWIDRRQSYTGEVFLVIPWVALQAQTGIRIWTKDSKSTGVIIDKPPGYQGGAGIGRTRCASTGAGESMPPEVAKPPGGACSLYATSRGMSREVV